MLIGIGNKVRFIHTGTEGRVVRRLKDGVFIVALDEGTEIPALESYLERIDKELSSSKVKAKVVRTQQKSPQSKEPLMPKRQYEILKSEGIQMAFEESNTGSTKRYKVYILNVTLYQALYDVNITIKGESKKKINGKVEPNSATKIMEIPHDYLSDKPTISFNCRQISTEGMSDWLNKDFRLKPKPFFSRLKTAVLLGKKAHVYSLFKPYELKEETDSLREYTLEQIRKKKQNHAASDDYEMWTAPDVRDYATFPLEKDLHIEKLVDNYKKLNAYEILGIQIREFRNYLEEAIKMGVENVFVIHGKGKGKLKNEIADILRQHPDVRKFQNEYHPKYGTGATEIFLS